MLNQRLAPITNSKCESKISESKGVTKSFNILQELEKSRGKDVEIDLDEMFQARDELYSKQQKVKQKCLKFRQKEYHFSAIGAKNIQKFIGFQ